MQIQDERVSRFSFGFSSLASVKDFFRMDSCLPRGDECVWAESLQQFLAGTPLRLQNIRVSLAGLTNFQCSVVSACRAIPYGSTMTYGQLAAAAGSPKAARAVGTVMARNLIPIIIPCHRVVAAGGLGQYSAGDGAKTKQELLEMEGQARPE